MRLEKPYTGVFQEQTIPKGTRLAGSSALVHELGIAAPVRRPACVAERHVSGSRRQDGAWLVFDKRYWPGDSFADHLTFILRREDLDLLVLVRIFRAVAPVEMEGFVREARTSLHARRAWFLYETLTGQTLDVEDSPRAEAIDLLDPKAHFTGKPRLSKRYRVRDNLLGTGRFCPVIRRTAALEAILELDLAAKRPRINKFTSLSVIPTHTMIPVAERRSAVSPTKRVYRGDLTELT